MTAVTIEERLAQSASEPTASTVNHMTMAQGALSCHRSELAIKMGATQIWRTEAGVGNLKAYAKAYSEDQESK